MKNFPKVEKHLNKFIESHIKNPIFYSLSGAHIYGFPSEDSDFDIRGAHIVDTEELFHFSKPRQTIEKMMDDPFLGVEVDFVSQEIEKFMSILMKPNGNLLEQINSPLQFTNSKHFTELKRLSRYCITKKLFYHYRGMAMQNYNKYIAKDKITVKKYLYVLRSLISGIHVLNTGKIEPSIVLLNRKYKSEIIDDLIEKKKLEKLKMNKDEKVEKLIAELFKELEESYDKSNLPEEVSNRGRFDDFLFKLRIKYSNN